MIEAVPLGGAPGFALDVVPSSPRVALNGVRLRPYQTDSIARLDDAIARCVRRVVVAAPTGSGKSVIAAQFVVREVRAGRRALLLAHRRELIYQLVAKLLDAGLDESEVGVIMGNDPRRRPDAPVQVASVDTLRRRPLPPADIVIVDECHRAIARSHSSITERYPDALHIGFTATPYRGDGRGLREQYDEMIVVATPRLLIADGFIVEPRVFTIPPGALPDLRGVRVRGGDYDERALGEAMNQTRLVGKLVDHWLRLANNERTVVFAVNVAHSKHIAEQFLAAGVAAEHVDGTTPPGDRDAILGRIASGETRVLCSCMLVSEGFDCPPIKCAILARPTKSLTLYIQQAGRILRPWEGHGALILDHAGCVLEHGLPHEDRVLSLDGVAKRVKADERIVGERRCPECQTLTRTPICPKCGFVFAPRTPLPEEMEGGLVDFSGDHPHRALWEELCTEASARGYRPGWVFHRFLERTGQRPPSQFQIPDALAQAPDGRAVADRLREVSRQNRGKLTWSMFDSLTST